MSTSSASRRVLMLSAFAALATAGSFSISAPADAKEKLICVRHYHTRCIKWERAPLPPKPDKPGIKLK